MGISGELIALGVVFSWSAASLFFEYSGKRIGSVTINFYKLLVALLVIGCYLFVSTGSFIPLHANREAWLWILSSGLVGFTICDLALFYSFTVIGSRYAQLIMTVYPLFATFSAWLIIGENMPPLGFLGMIVTISGVAMSIFSRGKGEGKKIKLNISKIGVVCAFIGAIGQGVGFVLSKKGMIAYEQSAGLTEEARNLIPLAATQIRCMSGFVGFFLIMLFTKRLHLVVDGLKDRKGFLASMGGTFFGPILGVTLSLLALQNANTGIVSTIMATQPIVLLFYDILIRKKRVSASEVIGTFLAVVGVSLFFVNL